MANYLLLEDDIVVAGFEDRESLEMYMNMHRKNDNCRVEEFPDSLWDTIVNMHGEKIIYKKDLEKYYDVCNKTNTEFSEINYLENDFESIFEDLNELQNIKKHKVRTKKISKKLLNIEKRLRAIYDETMYLLSKKASN